MDGPARAFFLEHARDRMSHEDMCHRTGAEYESDASRLVLQADLVNLSIARYMTENSITDPAAALKTLSDRITLISSQYDQAFRRDIHKLRFLRKAVIGQTFLSVPIGPNHHADVIFQSLGSIDLQLATPPACSSHLFFSRCCLRRCTGTSPTGCP